MGQTKLEKQINEKLNSREIQPSAQAWDRLDAMLTVAEEKKTRKPFGFLFIAASITVLLTAGIFFFSQKNTEIQPESNVVVTETKDTIQKPAEITTPIVEQKEAVASTDNKPATDNQQPTTNNQRVSINNQKRTINNQQQSTNPLINRNREIEYQNSSDVALKDLPVIETKKALIVYPSKENNSNVISDEQLLAGLDKTAKQSANGKSSVKVDAKSLLSQVDGELELTFREKVINKIAKNYKEVKVALANRNNE